MGNPVVDRAPRHLKKGRKVLVGGAEQAIVVRLGAVTRFVGCWLSSSGHAPIITTVSLAPSLIPRPELPQVPHSEAEPRNLAFDLSAQSTANPSLASVLIQSIEPRAVVPEDLLSALIRDTVHLEKLRYSLREIGVAVRIVRRKDYIVVANQINDHRQFFFVLR